MLILLFTLATQPVLHTDLIDKTHITSLGFGSSSSAVRLLGNSESGMVHGTFVREGANFGSLSIALTRNSEVNGRRAVIDSINLGLSGGTLEDLPTGSWSGLPIGEQSHKTSSESNSIMYAFAGPYSCNATIKYSGRRTGGSSFFWSGNDKQADKRLLEGFLRDTLANALGSDLYQAPNALVNGQSISGTKKNSAGKAFVPVQFWAYARGIALSVNREHGTLSFTRTGTMFVLPVAASRAKRGSEWRDLGGFVVRTDGKHYAPLAGLESLL